MPRVLDPIQFVMIGLAGWMNQRQLRTIEYPEYLREENRVLREQLGERRVREPDLLPRQTKKHLTNAFYSREGPHSRSSWLSCGIAME
jgi:hypothetical protein